MDTQTQTDDVERLTDSIGTMMGSINSGLVPVCSILRVPTSLRKSNEKAYRPKRVSVGPLHRERNELLYMVETKWLCMRYLLSRTKGDKESRNSSFKCLCRAIVKLDEIVRASYLGDIKLDRYNLAKIMALDGCFLLELLIAFEEISEGSISASFPRSRLEITSPGVEVVKNEVVLSDLTVLENQIPFFILEKLSTILFPDYFGKTETDAGQKIAKLALSLLGYRSGSSFNSTSSPAHFLELVHSFVTGENDRVDGSQDNKFINLESQKWPDVESQRIQKQNNQCQLKRCATRLIAAGVEITAERGNPDEFYPNAKFSRSRDHGVLEISPLLVTETTEAKWRNFIAWEYSKAIGSQTGKAGIKGKFVSYAFLFNGLICCAHDIDMLKDNGIILFKKQDKGIIVNETKKRKQDLLILFRKITEGIEHHTVDSSFSEMCDDLNTFKTSDWTAKLRILGWHYRKRFAEWLVFVCKLCYNLLICDRYNIYKGGYKFLTRKYNFVATVLAVLTVVQTVYAVLSYHNSKN